MFPPVFSTAVASSEVKTRLGTNPTRFYLFGEAPQNITKPYAVWQLVSGYPENTLSCKPELDYMTTQIDVYGTNVESSRAVAQALRDAFENSGDCYITAWRGETKEANTNLYRVSFDVDWIVYR